jgi:phosphate starvation-inducible membrane PsiE
MIEVCKILVCVLAGSLIWQVAHDRPISTLCLAVSILVMVKAGDVMRE